LRCPRRSQAGEAVWTREEEIRQGRYRTQAAIRFKAGFAADGTAIALDMRNSAAAAIRAP